MMNVSIPKPVEKIIATFEKNEFEIYVVGGAVRKSLLGKIVDDWDLTTNATPEEMLKILPDAKYENQFGTVMVPNEVTETPFDITTFRTEHGYSDFRRPDAVQWGKTLEEDLKRRDFTINALALKRKKSGDYEVVDLYDGQKDLKKKIIRSVGEAHERFAEDALRMMRAVRIASELGFTIEEKTKDAISDSAVTINKIARERVRDEFLKILGSPHPYEGVLALKEVGLLKELLPELDKSFGIEQKSPNRHHIHDVGTHCLLSLKHCPSTDPIVRFATLIHDIGKRTTFEKLSDGTITFYNHEIVGSRMAKNISERMRLSKKQSEKLYKLVRYHQFTVDETQTDKAIRRFIRNVGLENVYDILDLRTGDRLGSGSSETSWRTEDFKKRLIEVQKQPFTVHDLKITGHDIMKELGIKPGPEIGQILNKLFSEVEDKKVENTRKDLLKRVLEIR